MTIKIRKFQTCVLAAFFAFALGVASFGAAAEKVEQSYVKTNSRAAYRSAVAVGDVANHEVGQELTIAQIKYSNPNFKTREEWAFTQFNYVDGTGPHRGTFIDTHEDGTQTFGTFEGSQKTVTNPDGSWIVTWEGKYKYLGGTGKFKNLKGGGTYKGRVSSTEAGTEEGRESIEY